jgi:hypothetical protein
MPGCEPTEGTAEAGTLQDNRELQQAEGMIKWAAYAAVSRKTKLGLRITTTKRCG